MTPLLYRLALCAQDEMDRSKKEGGPPMPLTIVFVAQKARCDDVAEALTLEGVPAASLHGGLSQVRAEEAHASSGTEEAHAQRRTAPHCTTACSAAQRSVTSK
jgi:superfamily II helicase